MRRQQAIGHSSEQLAQIAAASAGGSGDEGRLRCSAVCLYACLPRLSMPLCVYVSMCLCVHVSMSMSLCLCLYVSMSLCLYVSLSLSLSLSLSFSLSLLLTAPAVCVPACLCSCVPRCLTTSLPRCLAASSIRRLPFSHSVSLPLPLPSLILALSRGWQGSDPCNWNQSFSLGFFALFYFVVLIALQSLKCLLTSQSRPVDRASTKLIGASAPGNCLRTAAPAAS